MRRMIIPLLCSAVLLAGCATSMVSIEEQKMENGVMVCYTKMYVVPQRVADDEESIREHIEKRNIQPRQQSVKPC